MVILCWEKSENQHLKTFQEILFFHSDQETNILVPLVNRELTLKALINC